MDAVHDDACSMLSMLLLLTADAPFVLQMQDHVLRSARRLHETRGRHRSRLVTMMQGAQTLFALRASACCLISDAHALFHVPEPSSCAIVLKSFV